MKGRSLREELCELGRLDSETALNVLRAVSGAVALAHENGLLHRDIKPENIFLAQSEHGQVAKILDFGLAKPLNPGATDTVAPTMPGALIGTPAYMSPEQLRGEAPAESWDVWALAVVAFEMLTGTRPFACWATRGACWSAVAVRFPVSRSPHSRQRPVGRVRRRLGGERREQSVNNSVPNTG